MAQNEDKNQEEEIIQWDDEQISAITPDIMRVLSHVRFFEKLDELFCPADGSGVRAKCGGNYALSKPILEAAGYKGQDQADMFQVLESQGGFCDCEILYNVAEVSRLKSEYWRGQAAVDAKEGGRHH